jgi:hypothetical protein
MIERLDSPENVLAFRAVGKVEKSDYESVLEPAVRQMLVDRDELRLVYELGDELDGYTFGAGWEDAKVGVGHLGKWARVAVVSDKDWVHHAIGMFRWMMPGDVRIFPSTDLPAAMDWAAA